MMRAIVFAAVFALASSANAATAFRTGKMEQAYSVTNQLGWNCEYTYAGKNFWMFFVGMCPASVEVR